jgi:XTP/dITP diphosphohydrolase
VTRVLLATTNPDKVREIRGLLADAPVTLVGLRELPGVPEPEETGETFQDNARLKAFYYDTRLRLLTPTPDSDPVLTVAEDSGLVVDALDGEPGVRSARFLRPDATYPERFDEIYRRLAVDPRRPRTARFVCALAAVRGGQVVYETTGVVEGEIASDARGSGGFGYDPIFYYPPYHATLAEVTEPDKLAVAHRGHAFRAFAAWLKGAVQTKNGER